MVDFQATRKESAIFRLFIFFLRDRSCNKTSENKWNLREFPMIPYESIALCCIALPRSIYIYIGGFSDFLVFRHCPADGWLGYRDRRFFPVDEFPRSFEPTTNGNRPYGKRVFGRAIGIQTARWQIDRINCRGRESM